MATGPYPPKDFLIVDAEFDKLAQELGVPQTEVDAEKHDAAMGALQGASLWW